MAKYPGTLETNNINEYGIVKADQIQGHRVVDTPEDLTKLTPAQLSIDKTDYNSGGALWFVKNQERFYYLSESIAPDSGGSSNLDNWNAVALFKYVDGTGITPINTQDSRLCGINEIENVNTINGCYLGDASKDSSFLTKSQIESLVLTSYIQMSDYLSESDIKFIISNA